MRKRQVKIGKRAKYITPTWYIKKQTKKIRKTAKKFFS